MEFVDRDADRSAGRGDPEHVAGVGAAHFGADPDLAVPVRAAPVDHVVHEDVEVGEGRSDALDHRFDAVGAGLLPRTQRDVLPVGGDDVVQQVGVAGERSVEGFDALIQWVGHVGLLVVVDLVAGWCSLGAGW